MIVTKGLRFHCNQETIVFTLFCANDGIINLGKKLCWWNKKQQLDSLSGRLLSWLQREQFNWFIYLFSVARVPKDAEASQKKYVIVHVFSVVKIFLHPKIIDSTKKNVVRCANFVWLHIASQPKHTQNITFKWSKSTKITYT